MVHVLTLDLATSSVVLSKGPVETNVNINLLLIYNGGSYKQESVKSQHGNYAFWEVGIARLTPLPPGKSFHCWVTVLIWVKKLTPALPVEEKAMGIL